MVDFQVVSRTIRDDSSGLRVGHVTVRAPDGALLHRRYLHTPDVVGIVAVDGGDLVLVREFRAAVGEPVLQVPMGKVLGGQDPVSSARAELAEEAGFRAGRCDRVGSLLACPGWMDQVLHVFLATELTPLPCRPESDDPGDLEELHSSVIRLPVSRFGAAIRDGAVRDARTIAVVRLALG